MIQGSNKMSEIIFMGHKKSIPNHNEIAFCGFLKLFLVQNVYSRDRRQSFELIRRERKSMKR